MKRTVLDNGLVVLTDSDRNLKAFSVGAWFKVGSRDEPKDLAGICHFLEHMIFKGTKKSSAFEIAKSVDEVGGDFNAFTTRETTCYHVYLLGDDYPIGLDVLTDVLLHSQFDPVELEREREVILQEIAMVDDSPEEKIHDLLFEKCFGHTGLGRPIIGNEETVKRITRRHLRDFFHTYYRPDRMILSVAGDASHEQVLRKISNLKRKHWSGRTGPSGVMPESWRKRRSPKFHTGVHFVEKDLEQTHLVWGFETAAFRSSDRLPLLLLNHYLGNGMSSLLFQEVREKRGLAYSVYSNYSPYEDAGLFSVYLGTSRGNVRRSVATVERCLERVKKHRLARADLQRVKDGLRKALKLNAEGVESRMLFNARNEMFLGQTMTIDELSERIDAIKSEDLQTLARRYFHLDRKCLIQLGPKR